jgi:hypothetical protein
MTTGSIPTVAAGWAAMATGVLGLLALILIILFFTLGQPFGTLNDIFIGLTALSSVALAWLLLPQFSAQSPVLSWVALVLATAGALVVATGSVLVVFGITGWYLAGLYMAAGNALIGLWLLGLILSVRQNVAWPHGLVLFGLITAILMALGLATVPGIFRRIDAWGDAPWYVNYVGQVGALGWLVLYPIWCVWLGRILMPG